MDAGRCRTASSVCTDSKQRICDNKLSLVAFMCAANALKKKKKEVVKEKNMVPVVVEEKKPIWDCYFSLEWCYVALNNKVHLIDW